MSPTIIPQTVLNSVNDNIKFTTEIGTE